MAEQVGVARPFEGGLPLGLECLREVRCWHLWVEETRTRKDGTLKATKVPYRIDGYGKRQNNSERGLGTYSQAMGALAGLRATLKEGTRCGVGISISHSPVVALDFDMCFDADGYAEEWADALIKEARGTGAYTEVSPSGRGLRVVGSGALSEMPAIKRVWCPEATIPEGAKKPGVEVFNGCVGYVTLTGDGAQGSAVTDISGLVDGLMQKAQAQTQTRVSLLGAVGNDESAVTTLPCLLPAGRMRALLDAVPCVSEVVGDHDHAVALYSRFAFVLGAAWPEGRGALREWALGYDGDAAWIDDLFARIDHRGVRVSHAKPFVEWLDGLAASDVIDDNAKAVVRDVAASVASQRAGVALIDGDGLEQIAPEAAGERPRNPAQERRQSRAAAVIAETLHGRLKWIEERGKWVVRDGGRWRLAHTHEVHALVMREVNDIAGAQDTDVRKEKVQSKQWIDAVVALLSRNTRIAAPIATWDADPWLLATPGGKVVDLRTGAIRDATPGDLMLRATGADPVPLPAWREKGPRWVRFLGEVFGADEEMKRYVQKAFGLSLIGRVLEHVLFVVIGSGGTGKTTMVGAVQFAAGEYAEAVPSDILLTSGANRHAAMIADLKGLRMAVASEVDTDSVFNVGRVKALTGGDALKAQYMRRDWFAFTPSHTLWLLLNEMPRFKGDEAMQRRLRIITMALAPSKVDTYLKATLEMEAGAILAWAIEGAVLYGAEGLEPPEAVAEATRDVLEGTDPVGAWFRQRVVVTGRRDEVATADLIEDLREWSMADRAERGLGPVSDRALALRVHLIALRDAGVTVTKNIGRGGDPTKVGRRGFVGMRLRERG